ncbi:DUF1254 domain-containing protein [Thalassotalea litorea]|uniref:DUF1254 domain-containing protein n=1 Tax=Thalassotalea litorea TaxID=2020715 RepID=A0A5R9IS04_9GAMM|nr:DUF1254 domain-containing protein [Thalassotalea litorea]TLU66847.1 DUF1254 domain-containing protein [Thalassotalea litorea]
MIKQIITCYFLALLVCSNLTSVSAKQAPNLEQTFDDSQLFTYSRIYHAKRVIDHLRHFGANNFASVRPIAAVDYSAPGIQHLVAIVDLRTSPVVISLPEQLGPYRSVQVIDLNYRQIFYQQTTQGKFKYVLSHVNDKNRKPDGKFIHSHSDFAMVVLRTLSGYPNASYSNKEISRQITLSGFSENIAIPRIESNDVKLANIAPQRIIDWLLKHHQFSPLEQIWLALQRQEYHLDIAAKITEQLAQKADTIAFWHNLGLMNGVTDPIQIPLVKQALSLMFNYPSMAATNRLEVAQRIHFSNLEHPSSYADKSQIFFIKPDHIRAGLWSIDTLPNDNGADSFFSGYHNFNTSVDYRGEIGFSLNLQRPYPVSQNSYRTVGYPLFVDARRPVLRSFYYQPQFSLLQQVQQNNSPLADITAD